MNKIFRFFEKLLNSANRITGKAGRFKLSIKKHNNKIYASSFTFYILGLFFFYSYLGYKDELIIYYFFSAAFFMLSLLFIGLVLVEFYPSSFNLKIYTPEIVKGKAVLKERKSPLSLRKNPDTYLETNISLSNLISKLDDFEYYDSETKSFKLSNFNIKEFEDRIMTVKQASFVFLTFCLEEIIKDTNYVSELDSAYLDTLNKHFKFRKVKIGRQNWGDFKKGYIINLKIDELKKISFYKELSKFYKKQGLM